ncbi:MAG: DegV family protein [Casimicrobiaceae bacterium]
MPKPRLGHEDSTWVNIAQALRSKAQLAAGIMLSPIKPVVEGDDALDMPTALALDYVREQQNPSILPGISDRPDAEASRRTLIAVDSACDIAQSWLDYHHIVVMPRRIRAIDEELLETREPTALARQLEQLLPIAAKTVHSLPSSPVLLRDTIQRHLRRSTTGVIVLTASARQSAVYRNAVKAMQSLILIHAKVRRSLDPSAPALRAWVIDAQNALTGCGVLLAEAVRLRERNLPVTAIIKSLKEFRTQVHTLALPGRFDFLARAAQSVEMQPIPLWKQHVAQMFSLVPMLHMQADRLQVIKRLRRGPSGQGAVLSRCLRALERGILTTPLIAVSYAGPLDALEALPEFAELRRQCTREQITLSVSPMSMTGALMLGPGALSVSFASRTFRA